MLVRGREEQWPSIEITFLRAVICWMRPTYRLSINSLYWFAVVVQAAMHVGGVLPIKPEQKDKKVNWFWRAI